MQYRCERRAYCPSKNVELCALRRMRHTLGVIYALKVSCCCYLATLLRLWQCIWYSCPNFVCLFVHSTQNRSIWPIRRVHATMKTFSKASKMYFRHRIAFCATPRIWINCSTGHLCRDHSPACTIIIKRMWHHSCRNNSRPSTTCEVYKKKKKTETTNLVNIQTLTKRRKFMRVCGSLILLWSNYLFINFLLSFYFFCKFKSVKETYAFLSN